MALKFPDDLFRAQINAAPTTTWVDLMKKIPTLRMPGHCEKALMLEVCHGCCYNAVFNLTVYGCQSVPNCHLATLSLAWSV